MFSFDYMFVAREQVRLRSELEEPEDASSLLKILVAMDPKSKSVFGHVVEKKGTDSVGYAATRLVEDIRWLGYTKLVLRANTMNVQSLCCLRKL